MRRPTLIILSCIGFLLGTIQGYYFLFRPDFTWLLFCIGALVAAVLVSKKSRFIPIVCIAILAGIALNTQYLNTKLERGLSRSVYAKSDIIGTVKGDPYWDKDRNYAFILSDLKVNGQSKMGDIKVETFSAAAKEGDRVLVKGKIFPTRAKPGYQVSYASVEILESNKTFLVKLKQIFYSGAEAALDQQAAAFVKGILVGARSSLPQSTQDTLNSVGLSHVVAVSGYNLTILVVLLQKVLRKRWLWGSLVISLGLVWAFTILTGASASIVRAAIMASVFLIASYYGRPLGIFTCISLTAAFTILINPVAAIEDIGWQLSFLSLAGIVVLAPVLQKFLPKKTKLLSEIVAVTLAAQIATIPYIMYLFGSYSLLAFVANLVVMPIVPFLMLGGFLAAMLGLILPTQAYVLASPLNWIVHELLGFLGYLQSQKSALIISRPSLGVLLVWYGLLSFMAIVVYKKRLAEGLSFQFSDQMLK